MGANDPIGDVVNDQVTDTVKLLVEHAWNDTEAKVKAELTQIREVMLTLDYRFDQLLAQLEGLGPPGQSDSQLEDEGVEQILAKVEQQWDQEIRTLKQELHQTILAHNHNADLIKHHKDTIEALREHCSVVAAPAASRQAKSAEIMQQMKLHDGRQKQQKQRELDMLHERIAVLEQQITVLSQGMGVAAHLPPGGAPPSSTPVPAATRATGASRHNTGAPSAKKFGGGPPMP